ncbi:hypothetical protein [Winogradskyella luteola]|uniref:Uncharacterized protein n=1 Tax=Winogradskyella luteola TaxID=2828330 RepID=A0A9X1F6S2_9FLAO|nr:hypothetical protein [Winogradskyella luteola]MBV7268411.1 hypothetical protein [Winogradskyella luteola]
MAKKSQKLTRQKLKDQETVSPSQFNFLKSSFLGTVLVILSGIVLYTDKIIGFLDINFSLPSRYDSYDFETLIWSISVTVSPLLLIIAAHLKTKLIAYVVPLYSYTLQLWFIIYDLNIVDKQYTYFYALGTCILIIFVWTAYNKKEKESITREIEKKKRVLSENEL